MCQVSRKSTGSRTYSTSHSTILISYPISERNLQDFSAAWGLYSDFPFSGLSMNTGTVSGGSIDSAAVESTPPLKASPILKFSGVLLFCMIEWEGGNKIIPRNNPIYIHTELLTNLHWKLQFFTYEWVTNQY